MNQQLGGNALQSLQTILGAGGSKIIIRSQLSPEITIDIANLLGANPTPAAVSSADATALKFIKPEVIITSLGIEKSFAPYGKPSPNFYLNILFGVTAAGLIGAGIAWKICKSV